MEDAVDEEGLEYPRCVIVSKNKRIRKQRRESLVKADEVPKEDPRWSRDQKEIYRYGRVWDEGQSFGPESLQNLSKVDYG